MLKVERMAELVQRDFCLIAVGPRTLVQDASVELDVVCTPWLPEEVSSPRITAVLVKQFEILIRCEGILLDVDASRKSVPSTDSVAHRRRILRTRRVADLGGACSGVDRVAVGRCVRPRWGCDGEDKCNKETADEPCCRAASSSDRRRVRVGRCHRETVLSVGVGAGQAIHCCAGLARPIQL